MGQSGQCGHLTALAMWRVSYPDASDAAWKKNADGRPRPTIEDLLALLHGRSGVNKKMGDTDKTLRPRGTDTLAAIFGEMVRGVTEKPKKVFAALLRRRRGTLQQFRG